MPPKLPEDEKWKVTPIDPVSGYLRHDKTFDAKQLLEEMLVVLKNCFIMGHGDNAICFKCYTEWPKHADDCELAAVTAKAEAVLG